MARLFAGRALLRFGVSSNVLGILGTLTGLPRILEMDLVGRRFDLWRWLLDGTTFLAGLTRLLERVALG